MVKLDVYDFLTLIYLATLFGSLIPFIFVIRKDIRCGYAETWDGWLMDHKNRCVVRVEFFLFFPILFVCGLILIFFGFPVCVAVEIVEKIKSKRHKKADEVEQQKTSNSP